MNPILVNALITVLTPLVIVGIRKLAPKIPLIKIPGTKITLGQTDIPKYILPGLAPFIGLGVAYGLEAVGLSFNAGVGAAVYGGLGVWLREMVDQAKKAFGTDSTTPTPPPAG